MQHRRNSLRVLLPLMLGALLAPAAFGAPQDTKPAEPKPGALLPAAPCVAALEKDFKAEQEALAAALPAGRQLPEYWAEQCGQGRLPQDIAAELLKGALRPAKARGAKASGAGHNVTGVAARLAGLDGAEIFDGLRGGLADVRGPAYAPNQAALRPQAAAAPKLTPQLVRETLNRPEFAAQKKLSGILQKELRSDLRQTAHGRELLQAWKKGGVAELPLIVGVRENDQVGAVYLPAGRFIAVNSALLGRVYPWAAGKDDIQLSQYLVDHPRERKQMRYDLSEMLLHEGWHAAQFAARPLQAKFDVPEKDYLPLEYEAKMRGAAAFMERVEAERRSGGSYLMTTDNLFVAKQRGEALYLAAQGSDRFQKNIRELYLSAIGDNVTDFPQAIGAQEERIRLAKPADKKRLEAGLAALKESEAYYKAVLPKLGKAESRGASQFMIAFGRSVVDSNPNQALVAIFAGAEDLRKSGSKWLEANAPAIRTDFEQAIDNEKARLPTECASPTPTPACTKRKSDLEGACRYISRDPC